MDPALARVEAIYDALNRRDVDAALALVPDDFEWDLSRRPTEPSGILRGRGGGRIVLQALLDAWRELRFERQERRISGSRVIVPLRIVARGAHSAIALEEHVVHVWVTNDDRLVAFEYHSSVASAEGAPEAP